MTLFLKFQSLINYICGIYVRFMFFLSQIINSKSHSNESLFTSFYLRYELL